MTALQNFRSRAWLTKLIIWLRYVTLVDIYTAINFLHHLIEVHLIEGQDLGHSTIYCDGKLEKKR